MVYDVIAGIKEHTIAFVSYFLSKCSSHESIYEHHSRNNWKRKNVKERVGQNWSIFTYYQTKTTIKAQDPATVFILNIC
jgi:hypothetical protein